MNSEREGEGTKFTIDRKIFSSDLWFSSPWKLKVFIYLLGHANHKNNLFMGIEIKRGQLIRSLRTIQKDTGYKVGYRMKYASIDTIRRCCEELMKESRIEQRTVQQGTLFTVCNYNELQPIQQERTVQRERTEPNNSRTVVVQDKNDKNDKKKYREFVFLLESEYKDLVQDFGQSVIDSEVEDLDLYIGTDPKKRTAKYKDHSRVIRSWLKRDGVQKTNGGVPLKITCPSCKVQYAPQEAVKGKCPVCGGRKAIAVPGDDIEFDFNQERGGN